MKFFLIIVSFDDASLNAILSLTKICLLSQKAAPQDISWQEMISKDRMIQAITHSKLKV